MIRSRSAVSALRSSQIASMGLTTGAVSGGCSEVLFAGASAAGLTVSVSLPVLLPVLLAGITGAGVLAAGVSAVAGVAVGRAAGRHGAIAKAGYLFLKKHQ